MNSYINGSFYPNESEIKQNLKKIEDEILEEQEKENPNKKKIMKLMNKQLMQGLFLQII